MIEPDIPDDDSDNLDRGVYSPDFESPYHDYDEEPGGAGRGVGGTQGTGKVGPKFLPGETIYVRDDESGDLWGPTVLPIREEPWPYTARHGHGYSRFTHTSHGVTLDLLQ